MLEVYKAGVDECFPQPVYPRMFSAKMRAWLQHIKEIPSVAIAQLDTGVLRLSQHTVSYGMQLVTRMTRIEQA